VFLLTCCSVLGKRRSAEPAEPSSISSLDPSATKRALNSTTLGAGIRLVLLLLLLLLFFFFTTAQHQRFWGFLFFSQQHKRFFLQQHLFFIFTAAFIFFNQVSLYSDCK
jgi:hypothetical protein